VAAPPDIPVVLLHGFLGQAKNLTTLARRLGEGGRQVITPDLPGHGHAGPLPANADLDTLADGIEPHLGGGPVDLVGHSLGGRVALVLARRHPERVRAVTLLDIGPGPLERPDSASTRLVAAMVSGPRQAPSREAFRQHLVGAGVSKHLVDWQMQNVEVDEHGARWRVDPDALAALHPRVSSDDLWAAVEGAPYRVHVIRGDRSPYVGDAEVARLQAAGARVDTVPAGHFVHVEALDAVVALVQAA
jgi:esterase